jgi:diguanylate cyclase (GGDEF)-like protein
MTPYVPNDFLLGSFTGLFLVILVLLELTRRRISGAVGGIKFLMYANIAIIFVCAIFACHIQVPSSLLVFITLLSLIASALLTHAALRAYTTFPPALWSSMRVLLFSGLALTWFAFIDPDLQLCIAILASVSTVVFILSFIKIYKLPVSDRADQFCAAVLFCLCMVHLIRALTIVSGLAIQSDQIIELMPQKIYLFSNAFLVSTLMIAFIMMVDGKVQAQLAVLATRDRQTGAYTRSVFFDLMAGELKRIQRGATPLTFVMVDLDKFKIINDTWGHPVGDKVITDFVANTMATLRNYDLLGRYGGDEFVILLPNTTKIEAKAVVERIRIRCRTSAGPTVPPYTFSVGLCCTTNGHIKLDDFINAADQALYRAKGAGRNRIEACDYGRDHQLLPIQKIRRGMLPQAQS